MTMAGKVLQMFENSSAIARAGHRQGRLRTPGWYGPWPVRGAQRDFKGGSAAVAVACKSSVSVLARWR